MGSDTSDTFLKGRIQVRQTQSGYRFSIDAVLLAAHIRPKPGDRILELGTGCGIVSLILAYRHPDLAITAVEVQPEMADMAKQNVRANRMSDRITVFCRDLKTLPTPDIRESVNWVITNPPYRKNRSGRINPNRQRAISRHEILATLGDIVSTAHRMLRRGGKFVTVYPAERLTDLFTQMRNAGIEPKRMRTVHSIRGANAKRVIVEGVAGGKPGVEVSPQLAIYQPNGDYTEEVAGMINS